MPYRRFFLRTSQSALYSGGDLFGKKKKDLTGFSGALIGFLLGHNEKK